MKSILLHFVFLALFYYVNAEDKIVVLDCPPDGILNFITTLRQGSFFGREPISECDELTWASGNERLQCDYYTEYFAEEGDDNSLTVSCPKGKNVMSSITVTITDNIISGLSAICCTVDDPGDDIPDEPLVEINSFEDWWNTLLICPKYWAFQRLTVVDKTSAYSTNLTADCRTMDY